jgi:acyl-CoA reductase-like NAD-dependent aldehyde dehydrogenase
MPFQAELGGNNAAIVWEPADLAAAASDIAHGGFAFAGQRCTATRRVIVRGAGLDAFLDHFLAAAKALPWGDPLIEATVIGPLMSIARRDRVAGLVCRARESRLPLFEPHGPSVIPGGRGEWQAGAWHPPVVLVCDERDHEIVQRESFGPVVVIQPADSWGEAITLCNGVPEGLVAAVFSGDARLIADFKQRAQAGVLKINQSTAGVGIEAPFGGWKASGVGPPEHGAGNAEFFTRWQAVYER